MQHIQGLATTIAELARGTGFVVTIEQVPLEPLAMGNHTDRVTVRPARGGTPPRATEQVSAEHFATTPEGRVLESAITKLVGSAPQAPATLSASGAELPCEGLHDWQVSNVYTGEQSCTLCGKEYEAPTAPQAASPACLQTLDTNGLARYEFYNGSEAPFECRAADGAWVKFEDVRELMEGGAVPQAATTVSASGEPSTIWRIRHPDGCTTYQDTEPADYLRPYATAYRAQAAPIDMILHCPRCGMHHVDAPEAHDTTIAEGGTAEVLGWQNPPHRSHLCHGCGHIWRPADVPTNGVKAIQTKGANDAP